MTDITDELKPDEGKTIYVSYPTKAQADKNGEYKVLAEYDDYAVVYGQVPCPPERALYNAYLVINKLYNTIDYCSASYVQAVASMVQMGNMMNTVNEALELYNEAQRVESESGLVIPNKKITVPEGGNFNH